MNAGSGPYRSARAIQRRKSKTVQPICSPFGCTRIWKVKITAVLMLIIDAVERDCSLDSIDAHLPKLDVAGSIPVSRSSFQQRSITTLP
jgi:hypothetical protein